MGRTRKEYSARRLYADPFCKYAKVYGGSKGVSKNDEGKFWAIIKVSRLYREKRVKDLWLRVVGWQGGIIEDQRIRWGVWNLYCSKSIEGNWTQSD